MNLQSQKVVDEAQEVWWSAKAEEAEHMYPYEMAVREGRGGSMLEEFRLLL